MALWHNRYAVCSFLFVDNSKTQRPILARALHKNAPFSLPDEPAAALYSIAGVDICSKFDKIARGKSAICISRRPVPLQNLR